MEEQDWTVVDVQPSEEVFSAQDERYERFVDSVLREEDEQSSQKRSRQKRFDEVDWGIDEWLGPRF